LLPNILINAIPNNIDQGQNISTFNISKSNLPDNVSFDLTRGENIQNEAILDNSESSKLIIKLKN
tara:strand:- start:357 stop:551 length:195 start_codon:yes stop_codon:yes gene_type:complete